MNRIVWSTVCCILALLVAPRPSSAEEPHRELKAHEHGHGQLSIAIEGSKAVLELEMPGDDIVGFEHAPKTAEQTAAMENAKRLLSAPQELFALDVEAGCKLDKAELETEGFTDAGGTDAHSEFHATYSFDCAAMPKLKSVTLKLFAVFPRAQSLSVAVSAPGGTTSIDAGRANPVVKLPGAK